RLAQVAVDHQHPAAHAAENRRQREAGRRLAFGRQRAGRHQRAGYAVLGREPEVRAHREVRFRQVRLWIREQFVDGPVVEGWNRPEQWKPQLLPYLFGFAQTFVEVLEDEESDRRGAYTDH